MKEIQLTRGCLALVDDVDYMRVVAAGPWHAKPSKGTFYAAHMKPRSEGTRMLYLHRFILGIDDPTVQVDHNDHDGLNCQRYNLRTASTLENSRNRVATGTSPFKGVSWHTPMNSWVANICVEGKLSRLGYFQSDIEAAIAYDVAALLHFGKFAHVNFTSQS